MNFTIRKAVREDVPDLLRLIRELALYEKAPDEVTVTEEELARDGFGDKPIFDAIVAETPERIVGMALYFPVYSTWKGKCIYLDDLIVEESMRGSGIGKALLTELMRISKAFGARRLAWQVLDWNEPAIKFYESLGSQLDGTWINCKLTGEQLHEMELTR
ncbi:MAG: GNAT family N-acetyltransferase [Flavobacteriales bacterium]|nr:GNAT family N-acetyltransferase [Flavobacteriales bacterium]